MTAEGFEDTELLCPVNRLLEEGWEVDIAAPAKGKVDGKRGYSVDADLAIEDIDLNSGYDALLLPGGKGPAKVREIDVALDAARWFQDKGLPIAAICHGPQVLISAGLVQGRSATSYKSVQKELADAGARVKDETVVVDDNLVTSRNPGDIPAFNREFVKLIAK
jgi:protease I